MKENSTILLVENNRLVCDAICIFLAGAGYSVLQAYDGQQAVEMAGAAHPVDLVLTEFFCPKLSGPEVLCRLRQTRPSLPVLFLTMNGGRASGRLPWPPEEGALWFKSVCTPAFLAIIRQLLRKSEEAEEASSNCA